MLLERIPIRDLTTILETIADYHSKTQNPEVLSEYVRGALSETITRLFADENKTVSVGVLTSPLESHLISQAQKGSLHPNTLGFSPDTVEKMYMACAKLLDNMKAQGHKPVILTSPVLRPALFDFLSPVYPDVYVISYNDLTVDTNIKKFDSIELQTSSAQLAEKAEPVNSALS